MKMAVILLLAGATLMGCAQPAPLDLNKQLETGSLAFLQDCKTTREQVLLRLGIPTAEFEQQRILAYRVEFDPQGVLKLLPRDSFIRVTYGEATYAQEPRWEGVGANVMLVFNDAQVLVRHSLVPIARK